MGEVRALTDGEIEMLSSVYGDSMETPGMITCLVTRATTTYQASTEPM